MEFFPLQHLQRYRSLLMQWWGGDVLNGKVRVMAAFHDSVFYPSSIELVLSHWDLHKHFSALSVSGKIGSLGFLKNIGTCQNGYFSLSLSKGNRGNFSPVFTVGTWQGLEITLWRCPWGPSPRVHISQGFPHKASRHLLITGCVSLTQAWVH